METTEERGWKGDQNIKKGNGRGTTEERVRKRDKEEGMEGRQLKRVGGRETKRRE